MNQSVNHLPEQVLTMSPVYTTPPEGIGGYFSVSYTVIYPTQRVALLNHLSNK